MERRIVDLRMLSNFPHWAMCAVEVIPGKAAVFDGDSDCWKPIGRKLDSAFKMNPKPLPRGPGDVVASVLKRLGYVAQGDCGCNKFRGQMNEWGWAGCLLHLPEIVAWFGEKARERQIEPDAALVAAALKAAWKELRASGSSASEQDSPTAPT